MRAFLGQVITMTQALRWIRRIVLVTAGIALMGGLLLWRMWQIRGSVDQIGWETAAVSSEPSESVTVTWLGVSTLLFDDGETQILIDGAFTRVNPVNTLLLRRVRSDVATINFALAKYRMNRLAAIIPVHSHADHAIDVGHVANRTSAVVLGSESTANIARGANVPVDQYQILGDGETRQFGDFTIKLIASAHAPIGANDKEVFPGIVNYPLRQPARVSAYKTGVAWSVVLGHPRGTTLVQGSAGFIEGKLRNEAVDVVMLCIAGLAGLGKEYVGAFWEETVMATGTKRVISIHHDDFTAPFGQVRLLPDLLDKVVTTAAWIDEINSTSTGELPVELPPFGQPIELY